MMEQQYLSSLIVILLASAVVVFALHKLRLPTMLGFIVAGGIIGPQGVGLITDTHLIEVLAEIGVVLLLFTIGIEFSIKKLLSIKKSVVAGGGIQVLLTTAVVASAVFAVYRRPGTAVLAGFLVALSSTAIVLKMLSERGEADSHHGRMMLGILIFQDICVVPMMLLVPLLAGGSFDVGGIVMKLGEAAFIIVAVYFGARRIVPAVLTQVVRTKSRELFITAVIVICLGTALLTAHFGVSLALGAFLAGLVISESEYSHQAVSDILPFKESFTGIFFVSLGMMLNAEYVATNAGPVVAAAAAIVLCKWLSCAAAAHLAGASLKTAVQAAFGLAQVGEFSFVLAVAGKTAGLIDDVAYQVFLSSSMITMIGTPFMIKYGAPVASAVLSVPFVKNLAVAKGPAEERGPHRKRHDHVIVVGFGLNGRNLAGVLRDAAIPFVAVEVNIDTVVEMKKKSVPIYFGDATSPDILQLLGVERARMLVIAISDPASARRIVSVARSLNPSLVILVRTRYVAEVDDLTALGASEVIPEEFETSIEIFSRVLEAYGYQDSVIAGMVERVRRESYKALRTVQVSRRHIFEKNTGVPEIDVRGIKVPVQSPAANRSIGALQIRQRTGGTVIAVRRGGRTIAAPSPDFVIEPGDAVYVTGERDAIDRTMRLFRGDESPLP